MVTKTISRHIGERGLSNPTHTHFQHCMSSTEGCRLIQVATESILSHSSIALSWLCKYPVAKPSAAAKNNLIPYQICFMETEDSDFTFPTLPAPKAPLTAQSTVIHAVSTSMGTSTSKPAPVTAEGRRNKIPLEKGFSQVDWLRISRSGTDFTGGQGRRRDITLEEVKQHRAADDAWMVLHGKVYNITPYLKFHPGGADILVKAAGRDVTTLFNRYHPWVNAHALLEKCFLGLLQQHAATATVAP